MVYWLLIRKHNFQNHMAHHHREAQTDKGLWVAVSINLLLTFVQVIGGVISGSLSLVADALHNLSDAASLGIALFAKATGRKPADQYKSFGYQRAEIVAALMNLTILLVVSIYLLFEAFWRIAEPREVAGWIIVVVAGGALFIDTATAYITYRMSKDSLNMKAAFLHNLADALGSIGVILAGVLIIMYQLYWVDTLIAFVISGFVFWQAIKILPKTIHILMEGTPEDLSSVDIKLAMEKIDLVEDVHHIHVWNIDEHRVALEAHVVVSASELRDVEVIKASLKEMLSLNFNINHSTLEFEQQSEKKCE